MKGSKWTAVTFIALTSLGAASVAFAGCTVTSGKVDDFEGGAPTPTTTATTPPPDSGPGDSGAACTGNMQTSPILSTACQSALEAECCDELKTCFNATAASTMNCEVYGGCVANCAESIDGGAPPTEAEIQSCITMLCDTNAAPGIKDAWKGITECAKVGNQSSTACKDLD